MTPDARNRAEIADSLRALGIAAQRAGARLAVTDGAQRNRAVAAAADALRGSAATILAANANDVERARARGQKGALIDRLALDADRIEGIARSLDAIVELPDPLGRVLAEWDRPNGLSIQRVSVPLGVIGIIYESRPNVTADAAALCVKSGNAVILRGGSESFESNLAIHRAVQAGLEAAGIDVNAVQMVPTTDRAAVGYLLSSMTDTLDVVVPRGGKSLIERVQAEARVPVIGHLEGICHVYLNEHANADMARDIVVNAKMRRTGICGAAESVIVDRAAADRLLPGVVQALVDAGCEIRGDDTVARFDPSVAPATEADWSTEYLDAVISIRVVQDIDMAIAHIAQHGSGHTDSIVTDDTAAAEKFLAGVDSAIVLHNASTQFADGGEFGMGAEIGIATGRVHARGPVGAEQLTSYKYVVRGNGQTRPQ